ncbi:phosphoesterase RecJ domain-containing protein [Desulforhopalus singaporensis]|uniref:Phosphoesterase RecJ domain-containing protein n=2 Tax=Desulforhopalus singaporensis TaxID=91360 RepID=A0A1H0J9E6_9BACT|nr:phosphoesterase RecJ domain-containing protein [Desulforhopalus singaporensis]
MVPEEIVQAIRERSNIVLFTHTHPDGDALGSLLALASILESIGKTVFCYLEEPVSHLYDFLPETERAQTRLEKYRTFRQSAAGDILAIALDCGDCDRLGENKGEFLKETSFLVIDHHQSHEDFGTARWVDATRSSTGEMVYELALALGAAVDKNCAFNLYVAICTDTGSFRYECTSARTMHIVGELLKAGVRPDTVAGYLYDNYSRERLKLLEMALGSVELSHDGQIAFMHVSQKMLDDSGASIEDLEGFINFPRSLKVVKVAALIKESGSGHVAVSLRAKGQCNVSEVAKKFKGGGHRNAAGFRCSGKNVGQVIEELRTVLARALENDDHDQAGHC